MDSMVLDRLMAAEVMADHPTVDNLVVVHHMVDHLMADHLMADHPTINLGEVILDLYLIHQTTIAARRILRSTRLKNQQSRQETMTCFIKYWSNLCSDIMLRHQIKSRFVSPWNIFFRFKKISRNRYQTRKGKWNWNRNEG